MSDENITSGYDHAVLYLQQYYDNMLKALKRNQRPTAHSIIIYQFHKTREVIVSVRSTLHFRLPVVGHEGYPVLIG